MDENGASLDLSVAYDGNEDPNVLKQAACLECRRSKVKCMRAQDAPACRKCATAGIECVVPEYHVGRYKGVKNKRSGLEKAIYQLEESIKKARTSSGGIHDQHHRSMQRILEEMNSDKLENLPPDHLRAGSNAAQTVISTLPGPIALATSNERPPERTRASRQSISSFRSQSFVRKHENSGETMVNNADNPLQLLAIASAIPETCTAVLSPQSAAKTSPDDRMITILEDDETADFFSATVSRLDTSPELDPVQLGLVSMEEAEILFDYFHDRLAHTRWGLDESIHTAAFVRSRSSYLFTSIMANCALFLPDSAPLSTRLNNHSRFLAKEVLARRFRSTEIVLAFMVNIPWMLPGRNWAMDDETCQFLSTALTLAIDLSLNRIVVPSLTPRPEGAMERIPPSDCIDAQRALSLDKHTDVDPNSVFGRKLLRTRERVWLALFTLDRGVCLARGRPWSVPLGAIIETCDAWHMSDIAAKEDGSLTASTVLRRDFCRLVTDIRLACDSNKFQVNDSASSVKLMKDKIEGFFTHWYKTWSPQIRRADGGIPPYVEILVAHGKLSAYCNVINHPTASSEVKRFFRAAGLTAALNVMRVAVQNESRLKSMPNNTVIMVSFAACFVLGLSTSRRGNQFYLGPSSKKQIQDAADTLQRIGSSPSHRRGASALFGKHIKQIMRVHLAFEADTPEDKPHYSKIVRHQGQYGNRLTSAPFILQSPADAAQNVFPGYDSLTDDQLIAAIQNTNHDVDAHNNGYQAEDGVFMDWLDWPNVT